MGAKQEQEIWKGIEDWCMKRYPQLLHHQQQHVVSDDHHLQQIQQHYLNQYDTTTQLFLQKLNLSFIHPFCQPSIQSSYVIQGIPEQGTLSLTEYYNEIGEESIIHKIWTFITMITPSLTALMELWLRLFAFYIALFGTTYLLYHELSSWNQRGTRYEKNHKDRNSTTTTETSRSSSSSSTSWFRCILCLLTIASSAVLMTDTLYILEFGPPLGITLFLLSIKLSYNHLTTTLQQQQQEASYNPSRHNGAARTVLRYGMIFLCFIVCILIIEISEPDTTTFFSSFPMNYITKLRFTFGSSEDRVLLDEGLYYDESNPFMANVVKNWPDHYWKYTSMTKEKKKKNDFVNNNVNTNEELYIQPTPWMFTGDSRTGLSFLLNKVSAPNLVRLWVPVENHTEYVALDIAFPLDNHKKQGQQDTQKTNSGGGYDPTKPIYLLFHGLNGGSSEEYVRDFIWRRTQEGATVAVMIARGLMDLPIRGMNTFHGARWEDGHQTSQVLRSAMEPNQILSAVGYSMGGIVLSNLVSRTGTDCVFDSAIAISGGLDMRKQIHFSRAQRLWQPMLTAQLRDAFVLGKWGGRVKYRLSKEQMIRLMRASHITELDKTAVVAYNGFRDVVHYYSEMSLLGDVPYLSDEYFGQTISANRRIHNVSIPLCVIHAYDDPLITWRAVASNHGSMHPKNLTKTGSGNLVLLLTKDGGHVGWPLGWLPQANKWKWMNDAAMTFTNAVASSKKISKQKN